MAMSLTTSAVDPGVAAAMQIRAELEAVRKVLAPDLNDMELQLFAMVAQRSRLDPFAKQIYAIKRGGRLTFQTGIDGFRGSAEETGEYRGSDEPVYGEWVETPFGHPASATVVVHRASFSQSFTAHWDEFYPGDQLGAQWKRMPRVMLAKVAEAGAFRRAFPRRFGDIYTPEEMQQADGDVQVVSAAPTARQRLAERRAAIEATNDASDSPESPSSVVEATEITPPEPQPAMAAEGNAEAPVTRCDSMSPFDDDPEQCRQAKGHTGLHRTKNASWPEPT